MSDFLKNKKLVIFDMDGTIIDSLWVWNEVDSRVVATIRGDGREGEDNMMEIRDEALRTFSKSPNPYYDYCAYLRDKYQSKYTQDEIYNIRYKIANDYVETRIDYKPFADTMIKKLKSEGYILAIGSTAQRRNIDIYRFKNKNIISKAKMDDYFDVIYARDDCKEIKPHPEVFLKILEKFNVKAEDAIVFEDALVGVEAAKRAGIEVCVVYDKHSDHEREKINALADYRIQSFEELL